LIFVNKNEQSNKPRYVRNTRKRRETTSSTDSDSSNGSFSCDTDSESTDISDKATIKNSKAKNSKKKINTVSDNKIKYSTNVGKNNKNKQNQLLPKGSDNLTMFKEPFPGFKEHIPKWGTRIELNGRQIDVTNTCTIDYFLFGFWALSAIIPNFVRNIPELEKTESLRRIIFNIDNLNWAKVREIWISNIMNRNGGQTRRSLSLFGSEFEQFLIFLKEYQEFEWIQICSEFCADNNRKLFRYSLSDIFFDQTESNYLSLFSPYNHSCGVCLGYRNVRMRFVNNPNFVFIQVNGTFGRINNIPRRINIDNTDLQLICATVNNSQNRHFYGIFNINDNLFAVDDLTQGITHLDNQNTMQNIFFMLPVTTCMYYKL